MLFDPTARAPFKVGVTDFNIYLGTGCVSFVYILSFVVYGGGPDILLNTYSGSRGLVLLSRVMVHRLWLFLWGVSSPTDAWRVHADP